MHRNQNECFSSSNNPPDPRILDLIEAGGATKGEKLIAAIVDAEIAEAVVAQDDGAAGDRPQADSNDIGDGDETGQIIRQMNEQFTLVLHGSKAVIFWEQPHALPEDRVRILTLDAFKTFHLNRFQVYSACVKNEKTGEFDTVSKKRGVAPLWLTHPDRKQAHGVEFYPDRDNASGTPGYFNLWRGFSVKPDFDTPKDVRWKKYAIFRDHLLTNVVDGDQTNFRWMFAWFAQMVQRPRERIGTAIVLRGRMGTGKTIPGMVIGSLFASHYFLVDDARYLTGNFNAHMASCLLLQVDEGIWAGDKAAEGRLKGLVTSEKQMIEAKGVDPIRLANFVRLFFSSNEDWVVPAGLEERRFAVFDIAQHVMQNHEYFGAMLQELDAGGREALLADLLEFDLDAPGAPNLRAIPKTEGLLEQKLRSMEPVPAWWFGRLVEGTPTHRQKDWTSKVPTRTLFNDFIRTAEKIGVRRKADETAFGIAMKKLLPVVAVVKSWETVEEYDTDGHICEIRKRVRCYTLPAIDECRTFMEDRLGQSVDWDVRAGDGESEESSAQNSEIGYHDDDVDAGR